MGQGFTGDSAPVTEMHENREADRRGMRRSVIAAASAALFLGLVAACEQQSPVSLDEDRIPSEPRTVEVVLPWSEFGDSVRIIGGYGSPNELGGGLLASQFEGSLDSRTLIRLNPFPSTARVRDTAGTTVTDSSIVIVGGRFVARLDTVRSIVSGPVDITLNYLEEDWHAQTASWDFLVDSIGDQRGWTEPGAGPGVSLGTATWDPADSDSIVFELDSAQVALFNDTTVSTPRTLRVDLNAPGSLIGVNSTLLRLDARPSVNPDTTAVVTTIGREVTFVYNPAATLPASGLRAGGAPAWRSILILDIPTVLNGPAELCAQVTCPFTLTPEALNNASLILTSRPTDPVWFQPRDSLRLDLRPVLVPERLPKSPLGTSFFGFQGTAVGPDAFSGTAGIEIPVTVTSFIRDILDPETGADEPNQLALSSSIEPGSFFFGDFDGPGDPGEPRLRIIFTDIERLEAR